MTRYRVIPSTLLDDVIQVECEDGHIIPATEVDQHTAKHGSTVIELLEP